MVAISSSAFGVGRAARATASLPFSFAITTASGGGSFGRPLAGGTRIDAVEPPQPGAASNPHKPASAKSTQTARRLRGHHPPPHCDRIDELIMCLCLFCIGLA